MENCPFCRQPCHGSSRVRGFRCWDCLVDWSAGPRTSIGQRLKFEPIDGSVMSVFQSPRPNTEELERQYGFGHEDGHEDGYEAGYEAGLRA